MSVQPLNSSAVGALSATPPLPGDNTRWNAVVRSMPSLDERNLNLMALNALDDEEVLFYLNMLLTERDFIPESQDRLIQDFDKCLDRVRVTSMIDGATADEFIGARDLPWGDDGLGVFHTSWAAGVMRV